MPECLSSWNLGRVWNIFHWVVSCSCLWAKCQIYWLYIASLLLFNFRTDAFPGELFCLMTALVFHSCRWLRSDCSDSASLWSFITMYKHLQKAILKRKLLRAGHWCTLGMREVLPARKLWIHDRFLSLMPLWWSLTARRWCGNLSKALLKAKQKMHQFAAVCLRIQLRGHVWWWWVGSHKIFSWSRAVSRSESYCFQEFHEMTVD